MEQSIFETLGLTQEEWSVYQILLETGPATARKITDKSPLKRGMVYKALDGLIIKKLVDKRDEPGSVAIFSPSHPGRLREILAKKEDYISSARTQLESYLGALTSKFNLFSGKPNVRFFEGKKGMEEVLDDSLYAKEEILTFVDVESIMKYIPKENEVYVQKREKLGIKKRSLVYDTPKNREYAQQYHVAVTDVRYIKSPKESPQTVIQIYDGKVSYLTMTPESMVGIIIEDSFIYATQRHLFNLVWEGATPAANQSPGRSKTA